MNGLVSLLSIGPAGPGSPLITSVRRKKAKVSFLWGTIWKKILWLLLQEEFGGKLLILNVILCEVVCFPVWDINPLFCIFTEYSVKSALLPSAFLEWIFFFKGSARPCCEVSTKQSHRLPTWGQLPVVTHALWPLTTLLLLEFWGTHCRLPCTEAWGEWRPH